MCSSPIPIVHPYQCVKFTHTMCIYKKEDVVWLPMRQLFTRDQMTQKLTTIGHHINNEQSPYHIVRYKRATKWQCKTIHTRKRAAWFIYKKWMKNKYVTHEQKTTTKLQASDLGQAHTYRIFTDTNVYSSLIH